MGITFQVLVECDECLDSGYYDADGKISKNEIESFTDGDFVFVDGDVLCEECAAERDAERDDEDGDEEEGGG